MLVTDAKVPPVGIGFSRHQRTVDIDASRQGTRIFRLNVRFVFGAQCLESRFPLAGEMRRCFDGV